VADQAFPNPGAGYDGVDILVGLARTLRAVGVDAAPDRVHAAVSALTLLDVSSSHDVYWAGRLTLCGNEVELERYDRTFAAYFGGGPPPLSPRRGASPKLHLLAGGDLRAGAGDADDDEPSNVWSAASAAEVLRDRDIAKLSDQERDQLRRLLSRFSLAGEARRSRRFHPAGQGPIDGRRTIDAWLRSGGEPARLAHHQVVMRPRRIVLLVDVSGSMDRYADALLRFSHAVARGADAQSEVFAMGTRLTRVTRQMHRADPDAAMTGVWDALSDAGGGTRLGMLVKEFLDKWGQHSLARGAVVVILSDGWDCGDPAVLGAQVARLRRVAHRVVWSNPRKAEPGFAPTAGGMAAALPHVDDFVEGHSLAALEHLGDIVLGRAHARM